MDPNESTLTVCPLLSVRSGVTELCLGSECAWYIAPVRKCALYVMGHKGAVELQAMQKQMVPPAPPKAAAGH